MTNRELTAIREHLRATGHTDALPFKITRAVHDIQNRLTTLRDTWCQTNHPAQDHTAPDQPAHGHTGYRPPAALRRAVEARHATCAFPTVRHEAPHYRMEVRDLHLENVAAFL